MPIPHQPPELGDRAVVSPWQPWVSGFMTGLVIAVTAALGIGVFFVSIREVLLDDVRAHLRSAAETAAAQIGADRHGRLTDSSQTGSPEYLTASEPLAALLRANPDIRFAYTGTVRRDSMFFGLDGDRTADRAYIGQPDLPTEGELTVSRTGRTVVERQPGRTAWGIGIRAYAPIAAAAGAYVGVTMDTRRYDAALSRVGNSAALGLAVALLLAVFGGFRAARVERTHRRAAVEILEARRLAAAAAEDRLLLEQRLQANQKMEALGTLAGGVAHDFNNLLTVILGHAEMIAEDAPADSGAGSSAGSIRTAAVRARDLVRRILLFARPEAETRTAIALGPVIDETVHLLRATLPSSITIVWKAPSGTLASVADRSQLSQVLMNLGVNASQALLNERGTIVFTLDQIQVGLAEQIRLGLEPGRYTRIVVRDDGIGISGESRSRIFEPFFTTKPVGKGSGLGLAVADGVIRGHGGAIDVETELGAGTAFSIYLPASDPVAAGPDAATAPLPKASPGGGRRVLLLDDDTMVLGILGRILGRAGYAVEAHADPASALVALEADPQGFDLLMTDRAMPGLSGPEVAQRARALNPGLPVMLLTGADQPADLESSSFSAVVVKPVDSAALLRTVERVLGAKAVV